MRRYKFNKELALDTWLPFLVGLVIALIMILVLVMSNLEIITTI
mgnify:CR=1 FL=1